MRLLRDNGLTIALMLAFALCLVGMAWSGWLDENEQLLRHHQAPLDLLSYLGSGHFLSALFENWESEFLQMAAYVVLTAYLFQRGSAESNDPDTPEADERPNSSWLLASPLARQLWSYSLGIALTLLFLVSLIAHWLSSVAAANAEATRHGEPVHTAFEYLGDAGLWFESFQNWQSEFLSTAVLVVLSIFLRYKGSPESKKLHQSDEETGA